MAEINLVCYNIKIIKKINKKYMDIELKAKLEQQEQKIEAIFESVEKMRKYFLWTLVVTVITFVLPLLVLIIAIPWFLKTLTSAYGL